MAYKKPDRRGLQLKNSTAKCLMENWVEERAVDHIDPYVPEGISLAKVFKHGHDEVLIMPHVKVGERISTFTDHFRAPPIVTTRTKGVRAEMLEQALFEKFCEDLPTEWEEPRPEDHFYTTFRQDYNKPDFVSKRPEPTAEHDYKTEQPVTFWTEHRNKIPGVSQVKTRDTSFRKNDTFSTPIDEYWGETQPYDIENYAKM